MSAPVIPPGGTIVQTFKRSFTDVSIDADKDNAINTTEFLEAAEALTTIFDVLGGVAFSPVKNDMLGNIKKVRDRQLAAPAESETLQELVKNELATKKHTATEGLLWLVRYEAQQHHSKLPHGNTSLHTNHGHVTNSGLEFTQIGLSSNVAKESEELSDSFRTAYASTLKPHHSFVVKPIFSAAMSATPYRKDFYSKLGDDSEKVTLEMRAYLMGLEKVVGILKGFINSKDAKW
jgi:hypothetical protein